MLKKLKNKLVLKNIAMKGVDGEIIEGSFELYPETTDWVADLEVTGIELSQYAEALGSETDIAGKVRLSLNASGKGMRAAGKVSFQLDDFYLQGLDIGHVSGAYVADGDDGQLDINVNGQEYKFSTQVLPDTPETLRLSIDEELDFRIAEFLYAEREREEG